MRFFLMTQQANHPLIRMSLVSSNVATLQTARAADQWWHSVDQQARALDQ